MTEPREISLQFLVKFRSGQDYKHVDDPAGSVPVYGSGGIFASASDYLYDGESVLFGRKGTIDRPAYVCGKFWTVDTMFYTELREGVSGRWLYYWATTIPFGLYSTDTALPSMTSSVLGRIKAPLVPHVQQGAIADYLDREIGEIDAMLAKLASLSESVSERRREIVHSILKSVGQTVRLGLVVDVVSGSGFPDRYQGISDEELPFYKVSSLSNADRQVLTDSDNTVSREIADQLGARVIPSQSVVMAKIGAALLLARYALTARPSCIDNNMQALVPHQGVIISRFLAYAMEGVSIPSLVKPGPVPSLDVMGMKMSRIAYNPSLKEQCRIADHLDEVTGRIDAMLATIDELKALLVERRAALITDVVTGRKKVPA